MIISIMQPTFMPWAGYFHMIKNSDLFIFLDDVQFNKRSWQQRNKFLQLQNEIYLTVPVNSKGKFNQKINDVKINYEQEWKDKHLKVFEYNYKKHPFFNEVFNLITTAYNKDFNELYKLNIFLIDLVKEYLSIKVETKLSSQFNITSTKGDRIIDLLKANGATKYLSPNGSKDYLNEGKIFKENNIELKYLDYKCLPYRQLNNKKFISHLSIMDAIFNLGTKTIEVL
jgi:hypothetical protein